MYILDDPKLKSLILRRKLGDERIKNYEIGFNQIYKLLGKTPTELIEEARKQQQPDWENKKFIEIEDRNITKYLNQYYEYLKNERKNNDGTIKTRMIILRSFYGEYNIELPKPILLKTNKSRTRKTDIPGWSHVKEVVEKLESKKYIAIVYFFVTSGIRSGDVCALTIGDFLKATKKYHNGTLEDLLTKDPYKDSIRPAWDFDPEKTDYNGNICFTSNTPQAMKALFDYLENRIEKGYPVNDDDALFRSNIRRKNNVKKSFFYDSRSMSDLFRYSINPIFNTKDKEGNTIVRLDKKGYAFFRPHNLRILFKTTCSTHLPKAMLEVEEKGNFIKNIDILSLLTGHEPLNPQITKTYEAADYGDIEPYYFHLIPYLTIGEIKAKDAHSDEFKELKDEIKELKEEKNSDLEWISNLRKKYGDSKFQEMLEKED